MSRIARLETLATEEVGKSGSPLVFVNKGGNIVAVFVKTRGLISIDEVVRFAKTLGESAPVIVEDSSGVAWENRHSERLQLEEDED